MTDQAPPSKPIIPPGVTSLFQQGPTDPDSLAEGHEETGGPSPAGGYEEAQPGLPALAAGRSSYLRRITPRPEHRGFTVDSPVGPGRLFISGSIENGTIHVHVAYLEVESAGLSRSTLLGARVRKRFLTAYPEKNGWVLLEGTVPSDTLLDPHSLTGQRNRFQPVFFGLERVGGEIRLID